jgi:hypothetical protein
VSEVSRFNLEHAHKACVDPDCEIHNPWVIEVESTRDTACAWYIAGMRRGIDFASAQVDDAWQGAKDNLVHLTTPENMEEVLGE